MRSRKAAISPESAAHISLFPAVPSESCQQTDAKQTSLSGRVEVSSVWETLSYQLCYVLAVGVSGTEASALS